MESKKGRFWDDDIVPSDMEITIGRWKAIQYGHSIYILQDGEFRQHASLSNPMPEEKLIDYLEGIIKRDEERSQNENS